VITTVTARNASKAQHTVGCIAHSPLRMNGVRNRKGTAGAPPAAGNRRRDFCAPAAAARRRPTAATRRFFLPIASGRWSARMQLRLASQNKGFYEGRRRFSKDGERVFWRKGWDSNPRGNSRPLAVFKTAALNHSATLPTLDFNDLAPCRVEQKCNLPPSCHPLGSITSARGSPR
jgi:hypothetical protein